MHLGQRLLVHGVVVAFLIYWLLFLKIFEQNVAQISIHIGRLLHPLGLALVERVMAAINARRRVPHHELVLVDIVVAADYDGFPIVLGRIISFQLVFEFIIIQDRLRTLGLKLHSPECNIVYLLLFLSLCRMFKTALYSVYHRQFLLELSFLIGLQILNLCSFLHFVRL